MVIRAARNTEYGLPVQCGRKSNELLFNIALSTRRFAETAANNTILATFSGQRIPEGATACSSMRFRNDADGRFSALCSSGQANGTSSPLAETLLIDHQV